MTAKKRGDGEASKGGRPSLYSEELADAICVELMMGQSLKKLCERDDMPSERVVYNWLLKHPEFVQKYARAREMQAERGVDEIIEIADDATNDWMMLNHGDNVGWKENGEAIRRSDLRIKARQWMAGKLRAKVYGDKVSVGGDPDAPMVVQILTGVPRDDSQAD